MLVPALIFGVLGIVLIAVARFWPRGAETADDQWGEVRVRVPRAAKQDPVADMRPPLPRVPLAVPIVSAKATRTWTTYVDPDLPTVLDLYERQRLVEGLGLVGEPWCAEALSHAYREEGDDLRDVIVAAIAICAGDVQSTVDEALRSARPSERLLALEFYARRGDVDILERALYDGDVVVALSAAFALVRANESVRVDRYLARLDDIERVRAIRSVLTVLV